MTARSNTPLYVVLAVLVVATVVSLLFGDDHAIGTGDVAIIGVLVVTFVKVWLIGMHFMELRCAQPLLRNLFTGYVVVVPTALVVLHLAA